MLLTGDYSRNHILWIKQCIVYHDKGIYKVFIAERSGDKLYSAFLYHEKTGSWMKDEDIVLDVKLKSFLAKSEKEALEKVKKWINDNLPGRYKLTAVEIEE